MHLCKKRCLNRFIYDMQNNCKKSENNYNSWLIVSIYVVYLHSKTKTNNVMNTIVVATKQVGNDKYELLQCNNLKQVYCNGKAVSKVYKRLSKDVKDFFEIN